MANLKHMLLAIFTTGLPSKVKAPRSQRVVEQSWTDTVHMTHAWIIFFGGGEFKFGIDRNKHTFW